MNCKPASAILQWLEVQNATDSQFGSHILSPMSDSPISQSGNDSGFFISVCSMTELPYVQAESDDAVSQRRPAQAQGNSMRAYTWLFSARVEGNLVDSSPNATFKALLDSRKERQNECLGVADVITFTCSDLSVTEPWTFSVEGFVHGNREIGGCSLKQWMPINHIHELKALEFEAIYPGHGQLDQRYRKHPIIRKFLNETSLEPSADGKRRLRLDFHGTSADSARTHYEESVTWFLRAKFRFTGDRDVSHVLQDREVR